MGNCLGSHSRSPNFSDVQEPNNGSSSRRRYVASPSKPKTTTNSSGNRTNNGATSDAAQGPSLTALHDFQAMSNLEITLCKGDRMKLLDDSHSWWWLVRTPEGREGYVPHNFVARCEALESQDWFFGKITRQDAVRMLKSPGAFLIRESETEPGMFVLCVHHRDLKRGDCVKHYKIRKLDNGGCYISEKSIFSNHSELIRHYQAVKGGLCCKLTSPCPKPKPVMQDLSVETKDKWEIPRKSVALGTLLGSGQFGSVYKGKWRGTTDVAIKTLKRGSMSVEEFLKEAQIMKELQHDKIVRLYAVCTQEEPIYIVTELMANGSLLEYLRDDEMGMITNTILIDMASQIASGMAYLEDKNFIHRDLAARNILVGENNIVKVADFGLARILEGDEYNQTGAKFPVKWTAPEAASKKKFSVKSDVWSYGILLYELMTRGRIPYPGMDNNTVLAQVERGYRMDQPPKTPDEVYIKMKECWHEKPEKRPTFLHLFVYFDDYSVSIEPNFSTFNFK